MEKEFAEKQIINEDVTEGKSLRNLIIVLIVGIVIAFALHIGDLKKIYQKHKLEKTMQQEYKGIFES